MMKNGQVHFRSLAVYAPKDFMFGRLSTLWTKRLRSINSAYMQERKSTKNEILLISKALGCRSNFFGGFLMKKFSICKIHCLNIEIFSWKKISPGSRSCSWRFNSLFHGPRSATLCSRSHKTTNGSSWLRHRPLRNTKWNISESKSQKLCW